MNIIIARQTLKTVGDWTLQRRDFEDDVHDYIIEANGKPAVNLFVSERPDFKTDRTVYTVEYTANSFPLNLEEAAAFVTHAQRALVAATEFQQAIDAAEVN